MINEWLFFTFSDKLKFSIKVSLALMLSYIIPLSQGWAQPSTAAITVMLIATAGVLGESLIKGLVRVIGTIIGAIIGLTLIALFPQERMTYLLIVSLLVPFILYFYNAYKGDGTFFMLIAMMILMVFKGGEVDDAFLYGVDKTYMTIFGIVIYTLVGIFLWPVRSEDSSLEDAASLSKISRDFFTKVLIDKENDESLLLEMRREQDTLAKSSEQTETWKPIVHAYQNLGSILELISSHSLEKKSLEYPRYITHYAEHIEALSARYEMIINAYEDKKIISNFAVKKLEYRVSIMKNITHLERSIVIAHGESLHRLQEALYTLTLRLNILNGEEDMQKEEVEKSVSPFVFFDPEHLKGVVQTFLIFWFSTALWIYFNPPGGFLLVTLATILSQLTSFSPLKPSVLMTLFSFGFFFAISMYVSVLPNLVYAWQLALFIFFYTFIAFYFIPSKISIFFLMGMYTLGIGNTMRYNFDIFLITLLVFYLFLAILMLFYYFPFSTKPETLFLLMKKRVFKHISGLLNSEASMDGYHTLHLARSIDKLELWSSKIDREYFKHNSEEQLNDFVCAVQLLASKISLLKEQNNSFKIMKIFKDLADSFFDDVTKEDRAILFAQAGKKIDNMQHELESLKTGLNIDEMSYKEIAEFYINIDLSHSLWLALQKTSLVMNEIDFKDYEMCRL